MSFCGKTAKSPELSIGVLSLMRRLRLALLFTIGTSLFAQSTAPPPNGPKVVFLRNGHIRISSGTMAGMLLERPDPILQTGDCDHAPCTTVVNIVISKTGTVEEVTPVMGPPRVLAKLTEAVKRWKYKPYLLDGEPREVETTITINFSN
jgi:periplasmic protein TonB